MKFLDSSFILSLSKIRALHLLRLGDQPYYTIQEVFEEIVTNSKILAAAKASNTVLFADDKTLVKKAEQLGIEVQKSPDFLKNRYQEGDMLFDTFRESINSLVSEKRLSKVEAEKILEVTKDAKKSED